MIAAEASREQAESKQRASQSDLSFFLRLSGQYGFRVRAVSSGSAASLLIAAGLSQ